MTDRLRAQLQTVLGGAYALERELGGGGMSRVFVARTEALGHDGCVEARMVPRSLAGRAPAR